jgi:hypothetical protein
MSLGSIVCSAGTAQFEGMERDLTLTPDMGILWGDSFGGPPVPVSMWGTSTFVHDTVDFQFTAWTGQTNGGNIEAFLPGYAPGWKFDLWLPGAPSVAAFPGFGNYDATSQTWQIKNVTGKPLNSMGQKAPVVPLWGYKFDCHAAASGYGSWLNERGAISPVATSVPALLAHKFVAHQIQDWSLSATPLPMQSGVVYTGVQHGRRRDAAVMFDHCTAADMDADPLVSVPGRRCGAVHAGHYRSVRPWPLAVLLPGVAHKTYRDPRGGLLGGQIGDVPLCLAAACSSKSP